MFSNTKKFIVQTLLLLSSFQQNNRRSTASWTPHALAVKSAFQIGLHSQLSYKDHGFDESELRKRLWFGVVVQDRYGNDFIVKRRPLTAS